MTPAIAQALWLAAILVLCIGVLSIGYSLWVFGGYLMDRYDAWRTNNWKGW